MLEDLVCLTPSRPLCGQFTDEIQVANGSLSLQTWPQRDEVRYPTCTRSERHIARTIHYEVSKLKNSLKIERVTKEARILAIRLTIALVLASGSLIAWAQTSQGSDRKS